MGAVCSQQTLGAPLWGRLEEDGTSGASGAASERRGAPESSEGLEANACFALHAHDNTVHLQDSNTPPQGEAVSQRSTTMGRPFMPFLWRPCGPLRPPGSFARRRSPGLGLIVSLVPPPPQNTQAEAVGTWTKRWMGWVCRNQTSETGCHF